MGPYDPEQTVTSADWLKAGEAERVELVAAYHRDHHVTLPNAQLHAVIHVVVENQVALGEEVVVKTLDRLVRESLTRHDAVHAIGSVLAEYLYAVMQDGDASKDPYARYLARLETLRASDWHSDVRAPS